MALLKNLSLQHLYEGAVATFLRFPLVLLSAFVATAAAMWRLEINYDKQHLYPYLPKLMLIGSLGLILFFVLELLVRHYRLNLGKRLLLLSGGVAFLVVYYLLLPERIENPQILRYLMLALVLHLVASYAMFINRREENAFWQFNKALFLRVLTSALYSAVLFIGLAIAAAALDNLFSIDLPDMIYAHLWLFMVGVFNTWFFLAGVPTQVSELEQDHQYPKGLKVFTQFVLLPLVTLYLVILYLYFGKIVVQWEWPVGWVSVLVLCFSIAGILSLLLIHPIRFEDGNTWMRTFSRWFYRALFPLIILLLLAIWRRLSEYGITEPRYVVLALALWLFCTALYFLLSRRKNIKFIPITLSIAALFGAFGPFNAFQVSEWSQTNRLERLLQENGILQNGTISKTDRKVEYKAEAEISSILRYLNEMHDLRALQPWFKQDLDSLLTSKADSTNNRWLLREEQAEGVVKLMGLEYRGRYEDYTETVEIVDGYKSFSLEDDVNFRITGYDYFVPEASFRQTALVEHQQEFLIAGNNLAAEYRPTDMVLQFRYLNDTLELDLQHYLQRAGEAGAGRYTDLPEADMTHLLQGKQVELKVVLKEVALDINGKERELVQVSYILFVKQF